MTSLCEHGKLIQFFVTSAATILSITDGMCVAWSAPMVPYFISERSHIKMNQTEAEWIETCFLIGVVSAIPITAFILNKLGRKKSILLASVILLISWISIACATKKEVIYAARVFTGVGINIGFVSIPTYVAEIAQKEIRGFLASLMQIMVIIGILIMYCIGPYTPFIIPPIVAAGLLLIKLLLFSFMPETPYLLCLKNKLTEAKKTLQVLRNKQDVEIELNEITEAIDNDIRDSRGAFKELFLVPRYRNALFIVLIFDFTKLCSCFEVVLMNMHQMLHDAHLTFVTPSVLAIIFAVLLLFSSILSSVTIDRFGRKVLFAISSGLTSICLLSLGIYLNFKHQGYDLMAYSWIPAVSVMAYAIVFKLGMGTVPYIIMGEIYATRIKGMGIAFCNGFHTATSIAVFQIYFILRRDYGIHIHFYLFSCLTILVTVFIMFFVPETKGKSLEEIQQLLRDKSLKRSKSEIPRPRSLCCF